MSGPKSEDLIDLNRASVLELQALPGVGPIFAERILERRLIRPISNLDELRAIGLTESKIQELALLVTYVSGHDMSAAG